MRLLYQFKWQIKSILESHPFGYYLGNQLLKFTDIFLPHEEDFYGFKKIPIQNGCFLDVGANDGKSARSFSKLIKNWQIISVEANPFHKNSLQKLKNKLVNYDFVIAAVGDKKDEYLTLYTPIYKKIIIHSAASSSLNQVKRQMKKQFKKLHILRKIRFETTTSPVIQLDSLALLPDVIKIDIEGMEYIALQGLEKTIQRKQPYVLVEYNAVNYENVKKFMLARGYTAYGYDIKTDEFLDFDNRCHRNCFFFPKASCYISRDHAM